MHAIRPRLSAGILAILAAPFILSGQVLRAAAPPLPAKVEADIQARMEVLAKAGANPAPASPYTPASSSGRGGLGGPASALATYQDPSGVTLALQGVAGSPAPGEDDSGRRTLNFLASGMDLGPGAALRSIKLTRVVDGEGKNLVAAETATAAAPTAAPAGRGGVRPLAGSAAILAPRGKTLEVVAGTAEVFVPTAANGGLVIVPDLGTHSGKPIPELQKSGIEFTLLTPASYRDLLAGADSTPEPGFPLGPVVLISDPNARLVGYTFRDRAGAALATTVSASRKLGAATLQELRFQAAGRGRGGAAGPAPAGPAAAPVAPRTEVPADGQIAFYLGVPEALRTISFHFEKIVLP